jgi:ArsR family metal-binding transcriptional regulator
MSKAQFDKVILSIDHNKFIVPKEAAMAIFELLSGHDVYKIQTWYSDNYMNNKEMAIPLKGDNMPSISTVGPVQFATMRANAEAKEEQERAEQRAKKEANA